MIVSASLKLDLNADLIVCTKVRNFIQLLIVFRYLLFLFLFAYDSITNLSSTTECSRGLGLQYYFKYLIENGKLQGICIIS